MAIHTVTIDPDAYEEFLPAHMTIAVGDTITFTAKSGEHRLLVTGGGEHARSGELGAGDSWEMTFSHVGIYRCRCGMHEEALCRVTVTNAAKAI